MAQNRPPSSAAIGWTAFASILMVLLAMWWVLAGFSAIIKDDLYVVTHKYVFAFSVTTWGWIHLLLGILVFFAAIALYRGAVWARTVGVILAFLSGLIAFAWLPSYPIWGVIFITVSVFVIWALTVHGSDIAYD